MQVDPLGVSQAGGSQQRNGSRFSTSKPSHTGVVTKQGSASASSGMLYGVQQESIMGGGQTANLNQSYRAQSSRWNTAVAHTLENGQSPHMQHAPTPSMPGRTQRVILNKRDGANPNNTAARLYKNKNVLQSAGKSQTHQNSSISSMNGSSFSTNASRTEEKSGYGSAFYSASKGENPIRPPFGGKELRFDGVEDLKEYFNREPGPGTYEAESAPAPGTVACSLAQELKNIKQMHKMAELKKKDVDKIGGGFTSNQKKFQPIPGLDNCDPSINVGPGQYDVREPQKHLQGPTMDYKGDFSLPFNEKNPLNYVKPITVNIYFKQANPGVGAYDPTLVQKHISGASHAFKSNIQRSIIDPKRLAQSQFEPGPGQYENIDGGFDEKWREADVMTRQFKDPVPKKIVPVNLYNPHAEPENDKKKHPEMCTYEIQREFDAPRFNAEEDFEPRMNVVQGGKVMIDNNMDRFGMPIRPMRPLELKPGPGEYEVGSSVYPYLFGPKPPVASNGYISDLPITRDAAYPTDTKNPGPAVYKSQKEPQKISFLFNPTEKWVQ